MSEGVCVCWGVMCNQGIWILLECADSALPCIGAAVNVPVTDTTGILQMMSQKVQGASTKR